MLDSSTDDSIAVAPYPEAATVLPRVTVFGETDRSLFLDLGLSQQALVFDKQSGVVSLATESGGDPFFPTHSAFPPFYLHSIYLAECELVLCYYDSAGETQTRSLGQIEEGKEFVEDATAWTLNFNDTLEGVKASLA